MNLRLRKVLIGLFACLPFFFVGCVDDKDVYDPNHKEPNPMEELNVPDDFDWKTMTSINLKVIVDDQHNGQYAYQIDVYDANPVLETNAQKITTGYARKNSPFITVVTVPTYVETLWVKQTTPTGLSSVIPVNTDKSDVTCNFSGNNGTRTALSAISRSDAWDITEPTLPEVDPSDATLFPTAPPADATVITSSSWMAADKNYIINSQTPQTISTGQRVSLYVTENATITGGITGQHNRNIYILPGKKLTINATDFAQQNYFISIGKDAELYVNGSLKIGNSTQNSKIYSQGKITATSFQTVASTEVYNMGEIIVSGATQFEYNFYNVGGLLETNTLKVDQTKVENFYNSGIVRVKNTSGIVMETGNSVLLYNTNTIEIGGDWKATKSATIYNQKNITVGGKIDLNSSNNVFVNDADIVCNGFSMTGTCKTQNNSLMTVHGLTKVDSEDTWVNNGTWITDNMETKAYEAAYLNACKLIVNETFTLAQGRFVNDAGAMVRAKNLDMTNTRVDMRSESFFNVTVQASLKENREQDGEGEGFYGTGEKMALLRMVKAVAGNDSPNLVCYAGKLQVACSDHPLEFNGPNRLWTMKDGAQWASDENNTVEIPKTECNEGWNTDPNPPTPPTPGPVVDPFTYSYLFEDMWPLYGDYDMNDIVLRVTNLTTYIDEDNKANKMSFEISLRAVGAQKRIGGAVMLDKVQASTIKSVKYSAQTPQKFNVSAGTGVENNQDNAVVPLFDEAHAFMNPANPNSWYINTLKTSPGNEDNVANPPVITVTIEFSTPVDVADLNVAYLNVFIVTDLEIVPINKSGRREIHLVDYKPTKMAGTTVFGNNNDDSLPSAGRYYRSKENMPWGIVIPDSFRWPIEHIMIQNAYGEFEEWVTSNRTEKQEWWKNPTNSGNIY